MSYYLALDVFAYSRCDKKQISLMDLLSKSQHFETTRSEAAKAKSNFNKLDQVHFILS